MQSCDQEPLICNNHSKAVNHTVLCPFPFGRLWTRFFNTFESLFTPL